jgi:hypothetical protein
VTRQNRGNECIKRAKGNKYYLKHAYDYYTKALGENGGDDKLDAVCLSNRAQAHLLLGAPSSAPIPCLRAQVGLRQFRSLVVSMPPLRG